MSVLHGFATNSCSAGPPQDLFVTYDLLWFRPGEELLRIFGVHFLLVRTLFSSCIAVAILLLFNTVLRVAEDWRIAAGLMAVALRARRSPRRPTTASAFS